VSENSDVSLSMKCGTCPNPATQAVSWGSKWLPVCNHCALTHASSGREFVTLTEATRRVPRSYYLRHGDAETNNNS
jgi:hypothetical protein